MIADFDPSVDSGTGLWSFLRDSIGSAMRFQLTDEASDLMGTLVSCRTLASRAPLFQNVRPPSPMTWVEIPTSSETRKVDIGLLIVHQEETGNLQFFQFLDFVGDKLGEPITFSEFRYRDGKFKVGEVPPGMSNMISRLKDGGLDHDAAFKEVSDLMKMSADFTIQSAETAFNAYQLLNAKNSPFTKDTVPGLSRQAYRSLKRKDPDAAERVRDTIRIRLNEEGRRHLAADRAERAPGSGAPRQAHWVRGHLMNAPTKGPVWRRAHVRGEGEPVMRTRVLTASAPEPEVP